VGASMEFDSTGYKATITPDSPLAASTQYTLSVEVCGETSAVQFTTSAYGDPLTLDVSELDGRTYTFDLGAGEYPQPEGLGPVLSAFLDAPLLIGVSGTGDGTVHIVGTQGEEAESGSITPDPSFDVWDFGTATLDGAYFATADTDIELGYDCATIPIYDFSLEGTFAADGSSIGGGSAIGLGDSRYMGCLIGKGDDPAALCDYAATFGFSCDVCPDGNPWCLTIEGIFLPAPHLEGVSLELAAPE
jgi:hypothetical protein